ncbi:MAG: hypothetical protein SFY69_01165 [Planctomycetota bacterium]|nr:hypothetical protein [Planctomycetota bacterium]
MLFPPRRNSTMHLRAATLPVVLLAAFAGAQDSVSRNANAGNGLPGDAPAPWSGVYQRQSFVVDLSPIVSAWGTPFGAAPVIKSGRINTTRFNAFAAATTISPSLVTGAALPAPTYTLWTQAGGGLHTGENNPALNTLVSPPASATLFALACLDVDEQLSSSTFFFSNVLQGAQAAYDPNQPDRLFVTRVMAAHNSTTPTLTDRSQLGLGTIDAAGNLVFRADSFGSANPTNPLVGDNYFRVRLPGRSGVSNPIDNNGAANAAAVDWLLQRSTLTHAVPAALPADIAGRSVLVGADFVGRLGAETTPLALATTTAHRPGTLDHRGSASIRPQPLFPTGVATAATLARSTGANGPVDSISLAALDANAVVLASRTLTLPSVVLDPCRPFTWMSSAGGLRGYDSQTTFRGPVGPVALGRDQAGRALAAGVLYAGVPANPASSFNAIAVARADLSQPGVPAQWVLAAWVDPATGLGKDIRGDFGADGTPDTNDAGERDGSVDATDAPIGRIVSLASTPLGFAGPSISVPGIDSVGNLYFIAAVELNRSTPGGIVAEPTLALVRAIYNPAAFCYELDVVLKAGDILPGRNSARNYRIDSLVLADGDSISSASMFASSVSASAWNAVPTDSLATIDPRALGGLALVARITYDVDQDGDYADPTRPGSDIDSPDESYNVVMYVGNTFAGGPTCDPDFNQDGNVDQDDVACLTQVVAGDPGCSASDPDFNADGNVDQDDISALTQVVAGAPCP